MWGAKRCCHITELGWSRLCTSELECSRMWVQWKYTVTVTTGTVCDGACRLDVSPFPERRPASTSPSACPRSNLEYVSKIQPIVLVFAKMWSGVVQMCLFVWWPVFANEQQLNENMLYMKGFVGNHTFYEKSTFVFWFFYKIGQTPQVQWCIKNTLIMIIWNINY